VGEEVLAEDFHATAYSTNVYLKTGGYRGPRVERGELKLFYEVLAPGDGGGKIQGG
jgi:hypothetical protein